MTRNFFRDPPDPEFTLQAELLANQREADYARYGIEVDGYKLTLKPKYWAKRHKVIQALRNYRRFGGRAGAKWARVLERYVSYMRPPRHTVGPCFRVLDPALSHFESEDEFETVLVPMYDKQINPLQNIFKTETRRIIRDNKAVDQPEEP